MEDWAYSLSAKVKALEKIARAFGEVYRSELEKEIRKVVEGEDWQVMPFNGFRGEIYSTKAPHIKGYCFSLGYYYGCDPREIGKIYPLAKKARFDCDKSEIKKNSATFRLIEIGKILRKRGYSLEFHKSYYSPKLNDFWDFKKK